MDLAVNYHDDDKSMQDDCNKLLLGRTASSVSMQ